MINGRRPPCCVKYGFLSCGYVPEDIRLHTAYALAGHRTLRNSLSIDVQLPNNAWRNDSDRRTDRHSIRRIGSRIEIEYALPSFASKLLPTYMSIPRVDRAIRGDALKNLGFGRVRMRLLLLVTIKRIALATSACCQPAPDIFSAFDDRPLVGRLVSYVINARRRRLFLL